VSNRKASSGAWPGGISGGRFSHAGAYVDNLGNLVPLAPGVFLNRVALGVCVDPPPFKVKGEVGIGFGPDVDGKKAIAVNGWFQYTDSNPWKIEAGGAVDVFGTQMADGHFSYESSGMVAFGSVLSAADIETIRAYVIHRAHAQLAQNEAGAAKKAN